MAILTVILVLCTAVFTSVSANGFADVNESDWFYNDVEYVRENKLMSGTSDSEFSPSGITTRGMIVTVLWRLEGAPEETGKDFEDVKDGAYYYDAVAWASNNNIVSGYSETVFGPDDTATREQLATIVYRYASYKNYDVSKGAELDKYVDKNEISEYAEKSIKWANASGLITGTSEETISPKNDVQRSQLAAILKRFCVNIVGENKEQDETDANIKEDNNASAGGGSSSSGNTSSGSSSGSSSSGSSGGNTTGDSTVGDSTTGGNGSSSGTTDTANVNISVDTASAKAGDEVEVAVKVDNNPGILGMTLTLSYDDTMCSLVSVKNGEAFEGVLDLSYSKDLKSGILFLWDGVDVSDESIKDGSILVLTFKVKDDAEEGACNITVETGDIVDNNLNSISPVIKNGEISISK